MLTQDAQGHPQYIEATFAGLAVAEVTVSVLPVAGANRSAGNVQAELKNIVHAAYKDFAKDSPLDQTNMPLTFTLVDSTELAATQSPTDVKFGVYKPAGASTPLLSVGVSRTGSR